MPLEPRIWRAQHFEAGTKTFRARITDKDGNVQTQANFSGSVTVQVFDLGSSTPATAVYSNASLTVGATVKNSLSTWDLDSTGYNFSNAVTSNNVAWEGGHSYRVCYRLNHTTEGTLPVVFEAQIVPMFSL